MDHDKTAPAPGNAAPPKQRPERPAHRPGQPGSEADVVNKPDTQNPGPRHNNGEQPIRERP